VIAAAVVESEIVMIDLRAVGVAMAVVVRLIVEEEKVAASIGFVVVVVE